MASEFPSSPAAASLEASRIMPLSRMAVPTLVSLESCQPCEGRVGCVSAAKRITLARRFKAAATSACKTRETVGIIPIQTIIRSNLGPPTVELKIPRRSHVASRSSGQLWMGATE